VQGRATGFVLFGDRCLLYDSRNSPEHFEVELSDPAVASILQGAETSYIVAQQPGATTLRVSSPGTQPVELALIVAAGSH